MYYTIKETREALKSGKTTSLQLVKDSIETFNKDKSASIPLNAFIEMYDDALKNAENADKEIEDAKFLLQTRTIFLQKDTNLLVVLRFLTVM